MALQLAATDEYGNTYPDAYHRIVTIHVDQTVPTAFVYVSTWIDAAARQAGRAPFAGTGYEMDGAAYQTYVVPAPTVNAIESTYTYLKTLPDFAGATDV